MDSAHDEVFHCFRYEVKSLSDDTCIPLKAMMTRMATNLIVREDGSLRHFNGCVTKFRVLHPDGSFAFHCMVLESSLAYTKLCKEDVFFHGESVIEPIKLTCAHYLQTDWQVHIVDNCLRRTCANQYDETKYNRVHFRWEEFGLMYSYEHRANGNTLWLHDRSTLAQPIIPIGIDDTGEIPLSDKAGSLEDATSANGVPCAASVPG